VNGSAKDDRSVSLVVFAVAGRAGELRRTLEALKRAGATFAQKVFSLDGHDPECCALAQNEGFDHILVSYTRAGYFASIQRAFALVSRPFFFWLEDDWEIRGWPPAGLTVDMLAASPRLAQVRLQKDEKVSLKDMNMGMARDDVVLSNYLYHLHPHFGRTDLMRCFCADLAFHAGIKGHNIEDALTEWTRGRGFFYGMVLGREPYCKHIGTSSSIPPGQRHYHDVWAGEEIDACTQEDAEESLRKRKLPSRLKYANDRHDLRAGRRLCALVRDALLCTIAFPGILLALPFSARPRTFIREMSKYWFRR